MPETRPLPDTILPGGPAFLSIGMTLAASLLMFFALTRLLVLGMSFIRYPQGPLWGEVCGIGSAIVAALVAAVVRGRLVTFPVCACAFVAAVALLLADAAIQDAHVTVYFVVLFVAVALGSMSALETRDWLLTRSLPWWCSPTLAPQPPWRFLARQVLVPLVAATAAAVIYASSEAVRAAK